jgi:hypothetical protein
MSATADSEQKAFMSFSGSTKRKLVFGSLGIFGAVFLALYLSVKSREFRIKRDVGISPSQFADFNGGSAAAPDTDVAVAELTSKDKDRLMTDFKWTPVNNYPWWEWSMTSDGKPPIYQGIPWYSDISIGRELYPVLSTAPPGTDAQGPFVHAWFMAHGFRYNLVFQEHRNLLWIVSDKPAPSQGSP